MYRHFAIVTVAITGLLAMFADGNQAQAVADKVEQQRLQQEANKASDTRPKPVVTPAQQPGGVWGSDSGSSLATGISANSFARSFASAGGGALAEAGYAPDYLSRLTPDQRSALASAAAANEAAIDAQKSSLEAASRLRSGSAGLE